jgi:predicted dehydrogenase
MGTERRLEIVRPYYAPPEISAALVIDDGNAFKGGELEWENFSGFNHYTLQCDAFSQAILTGTSVEFPIEDAIANMRALDALFRSAETGRWEQP